MCRLMQRYRWATEQKPNAGDQHRPPHSPATLLERMKMKVDWGYLTELYRETDKPIRKDENVFYEFSSAMFANFKHILAEREAAQAKIDALMLEYCPDEMTPEQLENWGKHQRRVSPERQAEIAKALAAFDKETE